jgi:hypothetical protein
VSLEASATLATLDPLVPLLPALLLLAVLLLEAALLVPPLLLVLLPPSMLGTAIVALAPPQATRATATAHTPVERSQDMIHLQRPKSRHYEIWPGAPAPRNHRDRPGLLCL